MLADLALYLWIPVSLGLALGLRPSLAATAILLGGHLLLPVDRVIDFSGLPEMDRHRLSMLCAVDFFVLLRPERLRIMGPGAGFLGFAALLLVGAFATGLGNGDVLEYGPAVVPGMSLYDSVSFANVQLLDFVLPALLGFAVFRRPQDLRGYLALLVLAALLYAPLVLLEARLSPQVHRWLYGSHQHEFAQTMRLGGWRPMVLMEHGLALALFLLTAVIAVLGLWRARLKLAGVSLGVPSVVLATVLAVCRSLGSLAYAALLVPLMAFSRPGLPMLAALAMAFTVVAYPALRGFDLFPTWRLVGLAETVNPERSQSVAFRFHNENVLLEKVAERPWLGWGSFGRNRVYDAGSGEDVTATDGFWIIQLGSQGVVGLVGAFGLLLAPLLVATRRLLRPMEPQDAWVVVTTMLICAIQAIDQLPNGFLAPLHVFLAAGLAGAVAQPSGPSASSPPAESLGVRRHSR